MDIPKIGLGFWQIAQKDAKKVVKDGLDCGYRHIDTAIVYGNEKEIGEALKEVNIPREEIFITSKIPAEIKNYEGAKKAIAQSLQSLQLDYLDLMLIHAPKPWSLMPFPVPRFKKGNVEVYRALMEARAEGKIKNIGVSNFIVKDLKNIIDNTGDVPFANQIRTHIGHVDRKTIEFCKENNIIVEAYSPNGKGNLMSNTQIINMAKKYNFSPAQICIQYDLQLGTIPLPRSKSKKHIDENLNFNFTISDEDIKILDKIKTL